MENKSDKMVSFMKAAVDNLLNYSFSEFQKMLPRQVNRNFSYGLLNNIFTRQTGMSLKEYFHRKKTEKANELLEYYHLTDLEVAYQLGFRNISSMIRTIRLKNQQFRHSGYMMNTA